LPEANVTQVLNCNKEKNVLKHFFKPKKAISSKKDYAKKKTTIICIKFKVHNH